MLNVSAFFDLARQWYVASDRTLNLDENEDLYNKVDEYMQKGDELRRIEIIQGVYPIGEKNRLGEMG